MKKYILNPLTNRYIEVGKYKYRRLIKGGVIEPYEDNKNKRYSVSTDEYIEYLKFKKDKNNNLGKTKNKSKIKVKKNDEKLELKSDINLNNEEQIINTEIKEEEVYQYNNKEEKPEEKPEEKQKPEQKPEEKKPIDLDETNFENELQKLITLELACPSTSESENESDSEE